MRQKRSRIILRCDGSIKMGLGHLSRCSVIAHSLPGLESTLVINPDPVAEEFLRDRKVNYQLLPEGQSGRGEAGKLAEIAREIGADWVVLDKKDNSEAYLKVLKEAGLIVVDIEDRGPGRRLADILTDAHVWPASEDATCEGPSFCGFGPEWVLLDPAYALLRFARLGGKANEKGSDVLEVTVSCGGSDPAGLTGRVLEALAGRGESLRITVVLGPGAKEKEISCGSHDLRIVRATHSLARILCRTEIAVVSGGITMCECMCLGIPAVVVPQHQEQAVDAGRFAAKGGILLGETPESEYFITRLQELLDKVLTDNSTRKELARAGIELIDGQGVERLRKAIESLEK